MSSRRVVSALQNNNTAELARFVHPAGLRVAPYISLTESDLIFHRRAVSRLRRDHRIYNWGFADGTGDAIRLPWSAFRTRYLAPTGKNFLAGAEIHYNAFKSRGNTINNLRETYPSAIFVEYYLPGTSKYDGMDWRGLWLVWRPVGKTWYLRALVSDQWTI